MKQETRWSFVGLLFVVGAIGLSACNSGGRGGEGSGIQNIQSSAPALPTDNTVYATGRLHTPGYGHTATLLGDDTVVIIGGSDERHFTTLDRAEIYDQTVFEDPPTESISGVWVDLDFAGDPILMAFGGRCFHRASLLPDGNVLISGGTADILVAEAIADAEIYDRQARVFNASHLQIQNPMINPRFNHTATVTASGQILMLGGQVAANETIIDPNFPPGNPLFMVDILTFPSTEEVEFFNPATLAFEPAVNQAGQALELQTSRGRAEHGTVTLGGLDNTLNTGDDKYVIAGGVRTLSPLFAPQVKFPQRNQVFFVTQVEYYDRSGGVIQVANGVETVRRANGVRTLNCGQYQKLTPAGEEGVTNAILFSHGNDDSHNQIGSPGWSQPQGELFVVTFTGFGPSEGISFWSATQALGTALGSNALNVPQLCTGYEYWTVAGNGAACFNVMRDAYMGTFIGRVETPLEMVVYDRMFNGEAFRGNWGITGGGASTHQSNLGIPFVEHASWCIGNDQFAMEYFDPFYNTDTDLSVLPGIDVDNPALLMGTWLAADLAVAEDGNGFGDTDTVPSGSQLRGKTCYHTMTVLPGEDGIVRTGDDRILVAGGGQEWLQTGGEPTPVSGHIFLPAGAND